MLPCRTEESFTTYGNVYRDSTCGGCHKRSMLPPRIGQFDREPRTET
jgi:hypothetical protein